MGDCDKSLDSILDDHSMRNPRAEACMEAFEGFSSRAFTFFDIKKLSLNLARGIASILSEVETFDATSPIVGICIGRGHLWYAAYIAAIRLGLSVAPLTQDIEDAVSRDMRNRDILAKLRPNIVLIDDSTPLAVMKDSAGLGVRFVNVAEIESCSPDVLIERQRNFTSRPLAYLYTGGTTRASKCAMISHQMAMHEMSGYPLVAQGVGYGDRVLQHSSTYWGATFLGQINIALAYGASVVFCNNMTDLTSTIDQHRISVLGLVPSQLGAIAGLCPSVKTVFTWGEKMTKAVSQKWRGRCQLVELLVSTEYWLSLYALNGEDEFKILDLPSVKIITRPVTDDSGPAIGSELLIGGECVTPFGYTDESPNQEAFVSLNQERFFVSSDLVQLSPDKKRLTFMGRRDSMLKIGGKWEDLFVIQDSLSVIPGVAEVSIQPHINTRIVAFVVLSEEFNENTINTIRRLINEAYIRISFVHHLPRHPVTGKVDRRSLSSLHAYRPVLKNKREQISRTRRRYMEWALWLLGIWTVIVSIRGFLAILLVPQVALFLLHFDPTNFSRKMKPWFHWIAVQYRNGLQALPAYIVSWSVILVIALPRFVALCIGSLGIVMYFSVHKGAYQTFSCRSRYVLAWTVTFWTGLPRELERVEWTAFFRRKSLADRKGRFSHRINEGLTNRVTKSWEPYGSASEEETKRVERALSTFPHRLVSLSLTDAEDISSNLQCHSEQDGESAATQRALPDSPFSVAVSDIISGICPHIPKPLMDTTVLTSVNSLSAVEVANKIRDSLGKDITVSDILMSANVGQLISRVSDAKNLTGEMDSVMMPDEGRSFRCQLWGWGFPCAWVFELTPDSSLPYIHFKSLQIAINQLSNRHPAFRVNCVDPNSVSYWMNETLVVVGLLRFILIKFFAWTESRSPVWRLAARTLGTLVAGIGRAVFEAWNRVRVDTHRKSVFIGWRNTTFTTDSEMREYLIMKRRKRNFFAPVEVDVMTLNSGASPRHFVRLYLTHAFSDGACVVPIAKELNELYSAALAGRDPQLPPPPPSALALQETRLRLSLTSPIDSTPADSFYLCYNMDMDEGGDPTSFGKIVVLHESLVAIAERASQRLSCPLDVLLLSSVACVLARLWGWTELVELALIVPLRDGPHEADVVGFLADQRNLDVPLIGRTTGVCCLVSVVETVHALRRKRGWRIPEPFSNCQRTLVNIVQANFPDASLFKQELLLQQNEAPSGVLYRPMELYIEQIDKHLWTLKARCRRREYSEEKFAKFVDLFKSIIVDMLARPASLL